MRRERDEGVEMVSYVDADLELLCVIRVMVDSRLFVQTPGPAGLEL